MGFFARGFFPAGFFPRGFFVDGLAPSGGDGGGGGGGPPPPLAPTLLRAIHDRMDASPGLVALVGNRHWTLNAEKRPVAAGPPADPAIPYVVLESFDHPPRRRIGSTRYLQQTHVQFRVVGYRPEDVDLVGEELWATFDLAREVNGVDIWRDPLRFAKGVETDAVRGVCPLIRDDSRGPNQRVLYYYVIPYDFDTDRTN